MQNIVIKPHTIIMTIGPSNCGKSYFCKNILIPFLDSHEINNKYFSSDAIRRQLLFDENLSKHAAKMSSVSKQAFELLENGVDSYTGYPVNTDVVVVDATHLSKLGRKNIIAIAKKNHYSLIGLLFDFEKADYFKYLEEGASKRVISDHIFTFRERTLKELERGDFENIFKIDSIDFSSAQISYEQSNNYAIVDFPHVCIVGDVHGCLDELIECVIDNKGISYDKKTNMLVKNDNEEYFQHILIGDFIDKGPKIKETIEFLHLNREFFIFVKGNHENWCSEYLKGKIKPSAINDDLITNYFDSVLILKNDEELKKKFFELTELCHDFILSDKFVITHAPCENKYLGKSDKVSVKNQRTYMYPKRRNFDTEEAFLDAREAAFKFLITDAEFNYPYHVFGHTPLPAVFKNKNKICIDTGCYAGGFLSTITFVPGKNPFIKKYKSRQEKSPEKLVPYFRTKENEVDLYSLDYDLQNRLKYAALNGLNFISGTMSPCDKKEDDLESLEAGIEYYKSKGVMQIMLQPKMMGSRAQILLTRKKKK